MQAVLSDFPLFHMSKKDSIQQQTTDNTARLLMVSQADDTTSYMTHL